MDGDPEAGILRMLSGSKVRNIEESCLELWKETVSHPILTIYALSIIEIAGRLAVRTPVTGNLTSLLSSSLAIMRDALSSQKSYLQSSWNTRWKSKLAHLNWFVLLQTVFVSAPGGGTKEDRSIYSIRLYVVLAIEETIHIHCYLVLTSPEWFVPNWIITWNSSSSQQCASSEWLVTMWGAPELVSGGCWHALVAPQTPPAPHLEPLTFKH